MNLKRKHPTAIVWTHWINFPLLFVMIWSGLLIYWANDVYRIGFGDFTLIKFFPEWFYNLFKIDGRLAEGMAWHFLIMWFFALNGLIYFFYLIFSKEWRFFIPNKESLKKIPQVIKYDLGLTKEEPHFEKFNPLQQIAYLTIIIMGALSILTGIAIYKPVQFSFITTLLGGYEWARFEHFWLTIGYLLFFIIHVTQVIKAGFNNFLGMLTGYEIEKKNYDL
ncbi:MAG: cytochrome b/b6 domain-containing protein [Candidatus Sericytochromatia bacterium]